MTDDRAAPVDLEELRRLAEKATPGPWTHEVSRYVEDVAHVRDARGFLVAETDEAEDAYFIAAARGALLALLDRLSAAERRVHEVQVEHACEVSALQFRLSATLSLVERLAADADKQAKLNPPELGDPIAVAGPWAWSRMASLLRATLPAARAALGQETQDDKG
jgi:hypothetical protein